MTTTTTTTTTMMILIAGNYSIMPNKTRIYMKNNKTKQNKKPNQTKTDTMFCFWKKNKQRLVISCPESYSSYYQPHHHHHHHHHQVTCRPEFYFLYSIKLMRWNLWKQQQQRQKFFAFHIRCLNIVFSKSVFI